MAQPGVLANRNGPRGHKSRPVAIDARRGTTDADGPRRRWASARQASFGGGKLPPSKDLVHVLAGINVQLAMVLLFNRYVPGVRTTVVEASCNRLLSTRCPVQ